MVLLLFLMAAILYNFNCNIFITLNITKTALLKLLNVVVVLGTIILHHCNTEINT